MMTSSEIRINARKSLAGKWKSAVLITLVYILFSAVLQFIEKKFEDNDVMNLIISVIVFIIDVPISFGFIISFIKLKRGENVGAFDFFTDGFSNFSRAWSIAWSTIVKMILPIILVIVAAVIFIGFSGASLIGVMSDVAVSNSIGKSAPILAVIGAILFVAAVVYAIIKGLLYSVSNYVAYDNPDMDAKSAVEESAKLMNGNRGNLVGLQLSFIGWAILGIFTFFIGYFWLIPYMQVATVCFYEALVGKEDTSSLNESSDEE